MATFIWDGWYIGGHGGYAWGDTSLDTLISGVEALEPRGAFGGLQVGFLRHLSPNWVLGFEADVSGGDINAPGRQDIGIFGTARTRFGYARGPWLLYGTGGVAWARSDVAPVTAAALDGHRLAHVGWAAGVGIEYALGRNWSARLEYLYADLDNITVVRGGVTVAEDITLNMIRLGINYRFGDVRAPVRALGYASERSSAYAFNWTGVYVGVHGGYAWGSQELRPFAGAPVDMDHSGGFAGIQSGANWQFAPNWLVGIEADSSWGSIKGNQNNAFTEIDSLGTLRGRFGYVANNLLLYTTAGVAWAKTSGFVPADTSFDRYLLGGTVGAGIEYMVSPNWSAKVEYLYTDFAMARTTVNTNAETQKTDLHTIKIGVNYRASLLELLMAR